MIKAIFFDFDGTISDAKKIAYDSMVRTLDEFGYEFDKKKLEKLLGERTRSILESLGLDIENIDDIRTQHIAHHYFDFILHGSYNSCNQFGQ